MSPHRPRLLSSTPILLGLALSVAACAPSGSPTPDGVTRPDARATAFSTSQTPLTDAFSATSDPFDAQRVLNRAIVMRPAGAACPSTGPTNWSNVGDLFGSRTESQLKRFCVYSWTGSGAPTASDLPTSGTDDIVHDRLAAVGYGKAPLADLRDNTLDLVDPVERYGTLPTRRARLVLLDTVPTSDDPLNQTATDDHGTRLVALADRFVCDSRSSRRCAGDVHSQLALGWEQTGTASSPSWNAPSDGGSLGRVSDIAVALVDAVDTWKEDKAVTGSTVGRLVINLSLGWHPESYGGSPSGAAEKAVQAALQYASCNDALVVVASGHDDTPIGNPGRTGASIPAAWETLSEPTDSQCVARFGSVSRSARTTSYRPLVHSVSALTTDFGLSGVARPQALPRLVAPGEFLTVTEPGEVDPNIAISGTSAAAVVASSTATVAWTLDSTSSPHDIMERVYTKGIEPVSGTTILAKVHHGSTAPKVRVANVCATAAASCGSSCSSVILDPCPSPGAVGGVTTASASSYSSIVDPTKPLVTDACVSGAGQEYHHNAGGNYTSPQHNCPIQQNEAATAIGVVMPMPPNDICDYCTGRMHTNPPEIDLRLFSEHTFGDFQSMTVSVHFGNAGPPDHYPLDMLIGGYASAHEGHFLLPDGALQRTVSGGGLVDATALTLDYDWAQFSWSEPIYLEP